MNRKKIYELGIAKTRELNLSHWLDSNCFFGDDYQAASADLYDNYSQWMEGKTDLMVLSKRQFGILLRESGFTRRKGGKGKRMWIGIGLMVHPFGCRRSI